MADLGLYDEVRRASQNNDELMQHIGLVKRVALHLKTRLPNFMELDELIQVGTIGLIEAAKSFDDSKGVEFEVFARTRIRGAILDQVRKLSYLPRSAIANIRDHNEATSMLSGVVPMTLTPRALSGAARLSGVWPPNWTMTPSGFSRSIISSTSSRVRGSK